LAVESLDQSTGRRLQLSTRGANGQVALDVRAIAGPIAVQVSLQLVLEFRTFHSKP
jgi:hypothetical protein